MPKDTAEIPELLQKAPQKGWDFLFRFSPSQLFLKGSKEEHTIILKHVTYVH